MPEPTLIFAGDTVEWTRIEPDYPAPAWQLEYIAVTSDRQITFFATPSGEEHAVLLSATTTEGWDAGTYRWVAKVMQGITVRTVGSGTWQVVVNLALQKSGYDARSTAQKTVDELEKAYLEAIAGHGLINNYSIGDTLYTFRSAEDIYNLLNFAKAQLSREKDRERMAIGKRGRRSIRMVF